MKRESLLNYFEKIKLGTDGDNTSNSEIIDYNNGNSITINEIEEEYYNYIDLQQEIAEYIEEEDLDDINDYEKIIKHFNYIDDDLFDFQQATLKSFVKYMITKINKANSFQRKANIIYNKNGNSYITTKITLPVPWVKKLGFSEENKNAIIKLEDDKIIIEKE